MYKRLLIFSILLSPLAGSGQSTLLNPYKAYLDSGLQALNMNWNDLAPSWEQIRPDARQLPLLNNCAQNPVSAFDEVYRQGNFLMDFSTRPDSALPFLFKALDYPSPQLQKPGDAFEHEKGVRALNKNLKHYFPSGSESWRASICRLLYNDHLNRKIFATSRRRTFLEKHYADLHRYEKIEAGRASPIEMKKQQERLFDSMRQFYRLADSPAYVNIVAQGLSDYSLVLGIANALKEMPMPAGPLSINSPYGKIYYGDMPPEDASLIILTKASSRIHLHSVIGRAQYIIDLGGDDLYEGDSFSEGAALFGINILIDLGGNDIYRGKNFDQGTGFFGLGIVYDAAGDDHYIASGFSQGFGSYGIGIIADITGNDIYEGGQYVQGVGMTKGYGAIVDKEGNDNYLVKGEMVDVLRYTDHYESVAQGFGIGFRPLAPGGIGILADIKGNDNYSCDIFGQGGAYWLGLGGLIDMEGNDNYISYQYAQGSAAHYGLGILIDLKGNDAYRSHGVAQGCGHDNSFGGLFDKEGDDTYTLDALGQGAGNANSSAFFLDGAGNDGYLSMTSNVHGYSDIRFGYGMPCLFFDLAGHDHYSAPSGNNSSAVKNLYGLDIDAEMPPESKQVSQKTGARDSLIKTTIANDVQGLFCQATAPSIAYSYLFDACIDSLVKKQQESLPFLMKVLGTESSSEAMVLQTVISRIKEDAVPYLQDSIFSKKPQVASRSLALLYELVSKGYGKSARDAVIKVAGSENFRYRARAYSILGRYNEPDMVPVLLNGLHEKRLMARRAATEAIARCGTLKNLTDLLPMLEDSSQEVRNSITIMISRLGNAAANIILHQVILSRAYTDVARLQALTAISALKNLPPDYLNALLPLLQKDWRYQMKVIEVYKANYDPELKDRLRKGLHAPLNSFVKKKLAEL